MSAGTIRLTNGSTAVVGTGTAFTSDLKSGDVITATVGGIFSTLFVGAVTSNTGLTLTDPFTGPTTSGLAWVAVPQLTLNRITAALAAQTAESVRRVLQENANWQAFYSGTGDITVTLPDGSPTGRQVPGPSWKKITDLINASDLNAIQLLASATQANATQAAADALSASSSKSAAKTSEINSKTSETNSKTSETNAAASLAAAQLLTSVPYEESPYPDVWAPFSDDLRLLAGSAPYDKLTVSGQVLELSTKSATFTRSTTATYIDKSGVLQTAAINEPRFEREGLLMEGASSNYILNSEDPTKWSGTAATLTRAVVNDGATQAVTFQGTVNGATANHLVINSSGITVAVNDAVTISARIKATSDRLRFRFALDGAQVGDVFFDAITGALIGTPSGGTTWTSSLGFDGYIYISATLKSPSAGTLTGQIYYNGATNIANGSVISVQTIQVEKNPVATSYIPTGASAVTRAGELVSLQASCNMGYRMIGDAFNRTLSFEIAVNKYVTPPVGYADLMRVNGASNDIIFRAVSASINSYISGSGPTIAAIYPFAPKMFVQTVDAANNCTLYFDDKTNARTGAPTNPNSIGTALNIQNSSNVVYHIRNFRIWHRLLTPNQIKGLR